MLKLSHKFGRLLSQGEGQDGMWQDSGQMRNEAFVDGKDALGSDGLSKTVGDAAIEITVLVVQTGHDGVCVRGPG